MQSGLAGSPCLIYSEPTGHVQPNLNSGIACFVRSFKFFQGL